MAGDTPTLRPLLIGLVSLVCVALIIGGVFSILALGAAKVTGLADSGPAQRPSLYMPPLKKHTPTPTAPASTAPAAQTPAPSPTLTPSPSQQAKKHKRKPHGISLAASPLHASPGQRIDLTGSYPGSGGTSLQVQNFQGGQWTPFPVSVTVSGGRFRTYIFSSNPGKQRFRVVDQGSGRVSNVVTIVIG